MQRLAPAAVGLEEGIQVGRREAHLRELGLHALRLGADQANVEHLAAHLEGPAHVLDRRRLPVEADADHVETRVALVPAPLGEEVARDARHARLLAAVDRLERRAGGGAAAAPHLDEHQHRAVERHQIDLPRAAAVVASHDRVPVRAEERFRHRLAPPPELTPPLHAAANLLAAFCPRKAVVVARPGAVRYQGAVAITREEVRQIAALARLRLEPAEEERLTADLDHILEAFARLSTLDTSAVEPTAQVEEDRTAFRDDVAANPPASEALLANAPARDGRFFRVPKIIE